ncbi:hypothetical protein PPL_11586 [Heterostelium album PN500]|uniref:Uncharacterized protein n=1 Tax=Heterostelium pallidum (strain ATCC 26659 / Pp 5 / PN500) TaxID=670386 RepID=D3BVJ5_HETP5|nr:hypothetical protein PPL_11586 [Heterostelium album PN500]EFA74618.1 hypothetical protein PPL_11586 [Heterostelium album PN500]|eukprot:XP_020426752.1 hypothetical protein PPL_11586 [Heterostelium album PN500]
MKFSIKSKSIEHIGNIEGIDGDCRISASYDGQDHIYLVNGSQISNRIDRFNIKTIQFERYDKLPDEYGQQVQKSKNLKTSCKILFSSIFFKLRIDRFNIKIVVSMKVVFF